MCGFADVQMFLNSIICTFEIRTSAHLKSAHNPKKMFDKLMQAQQKAGEVKKRLDGITVTGIAEGGKITVSANGNKVIQSIVIDEALIKDGDKEQLEELLVIAVNKAMEQADNVSQSEMAAMTKEMFGGLGGLF
jgi:DNA-binding YbaB/EbfC family protein